MTYAWREEIQAANTTAWGVSWAITAPWAHLAWSQYLLHLYDLTSPVGAAPKVHLPGATHEFLLFAIEPDMPLKHDIKISEQQYGHLEPPNQGYQFRAASNEAARDRLQNVVDLIVAEKLSPDADHRSRWHALFPDGFPMVRNVLSEIIGAPRGDTQH